MFLTVLTLVYIVCTMLLSLFAVGTIVLLAAYWRHRHDMTPTPPITTHPRVAVQLPLYNERYVVARLLDAVARLDWPRDCLWVQVLDDSTDETSCIVAERVAQLQRSGLNIAHVRRAERAGYKAGALAHGLERLPVEYVAVLDADFVPPPDFLLKTVPHLAADDSLGMVQVRWGHLNSFGNLLTLGQTLALDAHFVVEQTGRNRAGWLMNFSGSGGVWRVAAIHDAGGWRDVTLTEDLDLSYRAQLRGWRFLYLPDVVVPAELPPHLTAYKQQQARWATGGTQCLTRLIAPLWRDPRLTTGQRIMATLHLSQYLPAPLLLLLLLLTPPLLLAHGQMSVSLGPLSLAGLGPPLMLIVAQQALYPDWRRRLLALPALIIVATGLAWNNARAVAAGIFSQPHEFKRTPKYALAFHAGNQYALSGDPTSVIELALALYALLGALVAWRLYPAVVPYLLIYSIAFGVVALAGLRDSWRQPRPAGSDDA